MKIRTGPFAALSLAQARRDTLGRLANRLD